jgi:iron complex transport system ATP-binding protein
MSAQPIMLQAQDLTVMRGSHRVIAGLDLAVPAGQWVAIIGPNGAGKSTLLQALAGLLPAQEGLVQARAGALPGATLQALVSVRKLPARHLAWLGQDPLGEDTLSVRDTVALGRVPHHGWLGWGGWQACDEAALMSALIDTDMAWAESRLMGSLSGGERQRVSLARALAVQAAVLMLDEPVAHLDAPHQRLVARVLRREAERGCCIISVLHELPLALAADRLVLLRDGQMVADGPRDDPAVHRAIEAMFDHAMVIRQVDGQWVSLPQY